MAARIGFDKWFGMALAGLTALITVIVFVVRIDDKVGSLETRFTVVETTINEIAPRKVRVTASAPPLLTAPVAAPMAPQFAALLGLIPTAPFWPRLSTEALP